MQDKKPIPTADGPAGLTVLKGLARDRSLLTAMKGMHDELCSIFQITMPRFQPIVVSGPELNRQVLVTERDKFRWHGVSRLGSGSLRHNGLKALIPAIFITGVMMPLWTMLFNRRYIRDIPRLRLIWLAAVVAFFPWARRFNEEQITENGKRKTALRALIVPAAAFFLCRFRRCGVWCPGSWVGAFLGRIERFNSSWQLSADN